MRFEAENVASNRGNQFHFKKFHSVVHRVSLVPLRTMDSQAIREAVEANSLNVRPVYRNGSWF